VRWVQISGHTYYRFHIAVIDPNGHAAYTSGMTLCLAHAQTLRYGSADTMIEPCAA
jgi:hypothetical protein